MSKLDIFKHILKILVEINPQKFEKTQKLVEGCTFNSSDSMLSQKESLLNAAGNLSLCSYYVTPLIAYCGGYSIGGFTTGYIAQRSHVATILFLTEFFHLCGIKRSFIVTTNNQATEKWCNYIRSIVKKMGETAIEVRGITNANTNNSIQLTTFDSYSFSRRFSMLSEENKRNTIKVMLQHAFSSPEPTVSKDIDKPKEDVNIRTPKVRKNNSSIRLTKQPDN